METMDEKRSKDECIDRISDLPDSILGHIMSYLSTKNMVATSILSTKWKTLFPSNVQLTQLYLDDKELLNLPENNLKSRFPSSSFTDFVDKLFYETLRYVKIVERIVFYCEKDYGNAKILSWVRAAVSLNVRNLTLMFTSNLDDLGALFCIVNGCTTLMELEVRSPYHLHVPEVFLLPNLKRLALHTMSPYKCAYSLHALLDGCPVLEELSFSCCDFWGADTFYIESNLLKKLCIEQSSHEDVCRIVIDAPNLEYFIYDGVCVADYSVKRFKVLRAVSIGFHRNLPIPSNFHSRVAKLVKACLSAKRLCLDGKTITAMHHSLESVPLPRFRNLTCLALGTMERHGWEMLARLFLKAPKLELLKIQQGFGNYPGNYAAFESLLTRLPGCLKLCFKKFEFWEFQGQEDEIKLIEYFLKNGRVLQEVLIYCCGGNQDTEICRRLCSFKKRSKTCQIHLLEKDDRVKLSRNPRIEWF